jgi:hypothetical protein
MVGMKHLREKPKILVITEDSGFLRGLRVDMPLVNLKKHGLIGDYYVTDPTLFDVPNELVFDVVWLQRIRNEKLITHLDRQINSSYLYDLDDFMMGVPSYIPEHELRNKDVIMKAIADCKVLTVTSARLAKLLETATGNVLQGKTLVCPNGFEFGSGIKTPSKPQGIVLTQSDRLALTSSLKDVMKAVIDFSERHDLRILFFGSFDKEITSWSPRIIHVGRPTLWHYHAVLSALPPMMGIAPLETEADAATLDFVNGKSDVKMVSYGGMGHPSVYSDAPPYADSDLGVGVLVENTSDSWMQGLETIYHDAWRNSDREQERVIELRNMDRVASESWYQAIERARLPGPLIGKDIKFSSGRTSFYVEALRHMVFSQDHAFRRRLRENMPPLLVRTLRKFVMKG